MISKLLSRLPMYALLIVSAVGVSLLFSGLTTNQLMLMLGFLGLLVLIDKGNTIAVREISICSKHDLADPVIRDVNVMTGWSFGPILALSAVSPALANVLFLGVIVVFLKPIMMVLTAGKRARLVRSRAIAQMKSDPCEVAFYLSGPTNSGYQINQWIPVAERMNLRSAICVRKLNLLHEIDATSVPIYYAKTAADVEAIKDAIGLRLFLYPANPRDNATSLRHSDIQHYFINHGESDKSVNQSKFLMAYDKLLLGGPMAKKRLEAAGLPVRDNQVAYVGRPQLEIYLEKQDRPKLIKKIFYAPTWEGFVDNSNYSSVSDFGIKMLKNLLSDSEIEVVFKPHPFTGSRQKSTKKAMKAISDLVKEYPNFEEVGDEHKIYYHMNQCDLMIADIGSVVNDFLASGKPIIVTSVQGLSDDDLHAEFPTTRGTYIAEDPTKISALVSSISRADVMFEVRRDVRIDSVSDFPEGSLARFEREVRRGVEAI